MLAKDIMTREVITVTPDDTVEDVIKLLVDKKVSGVPVIDEEKRVIGIITEGDLIVRSQKLHAPSFIQFLGGIIYLDDPDEFREELKKAVAYKAADIMTEFPLTVDDDADIEEVATIMTEEGINRVPVVKDDKLVGIISRADIIRSLAKQNSPEGDEP